MAVLQPDELVEFRVMMARNAATIHFTKAQMNAAMQAIEDRLRSPATQIALSSDIELASPGIFNNSQKALLFGIWCVSAARRLGVL